MENATANRMVRKWRRFDIWRFLINAYFTVSSVVLFIVPMMMVISVSLTNEDEIYRSGYRLFPPYIDTTAYQFIFSNMSQVLNSYAVTAFQSLLGTFLSVLIMALCAYALSKSFFILKKVITFYIFFTMIFSGGLVPSYIIITQYLKLGNTVWVYILPGLVTGWYIIIMRTFFQGLPISLSESAKLDGASEPRIFVQIVLPLSAPVLATMSLLILLERWNNWYTALLYIRNPNLYSLQFLLQKILMESQAMQSMIDNVPPWLEKQYNFKMPLESLRYAMCIVAAGPMLLIFPFFQKYFTKGLTVGAVKG